MTFKSRILSIGLSLIMVLSAIYTPFFADKAYAASWYGNDYRFWNQCQSAYSEINKVGCLIVAQRKLLFEAGVNTNVSYTPDNWYSWLCSHGKLVNPPYNLKMKDHKGPSEYANEQGQNLQLLSVSGSPSNDKIWQNINTGYYTILEVKNGGHWVMVDNATSKRTGVIHIYESWTGSEACDYVVNYQTKYGYSSQMVVYKKTDSEKPTLSVSAGNSAIATKISWTKGKSAKTYNLRIKKKDGSAYKTYKDVWGLTSTSYSLTLPAGNYSVYVDACNDSKYYASNTVTFAIQEGVGKSTLSVTAGDSASATKISWTKAAKATIYNLRIKKKDSGSYKTYKDVWNMTTNSYSLTLPVGEYSVYVDACNGSKYTASNTVTFTVKAFSIGKPTLSATVGDSASATKISWTKPENTTIYNLRIKKKDGGSYKTYKDVWNMTTNSYSLTLPVGEYSVYVDAGNGSAYTASNTVTFAVKEFTVGKPTLSVIAGSSKTATKITWTKGKNAKIYNLRIKKKDGSSYKTYKDVWNLTTTSHSVKLPAGEYSVYVDACNGDKYIASNTLKFTVNSVNFSVDEENCTHSWDEGIITTQPSCTAGAKSYTCQFCGVQKTEEIEAISEHAYGDDDICDTCGYVDGVPNPEQYGVGAVTLSTSSYVYNGKVKSPRVIVKDSAGNILQKDVDYTVTTPKGRKAIGKYTYTIAFMEEFAGTEPMELVLTIKPKAPTITTPKAAKKAVTVKWKKGKKAQVTGYQVMVATNKKFTKNAKTVNVKGYKMASKKVTKLKAKTKYFVKVRTYKTVKGVKIYSDWCKVKTCRTK